MKLEEKNSTCTCESYRNATIKYGAMLDEYFKINEMLRTEILKLKENAKNSNNAYMQEVINIEAEKRTLELEIQHLKDYIKFTL